MPDTLGPPSTIRPDPDPTLATEKLVHREVSSALALIEARFGSFDERISAVNRATEVFQENLVRVPTEVQKAVGASTELLQTRIDALRDINDQKFHKIDIELYERELRRKQIKEDADSALSAALASAKEASIKSESNTTKQIDQQGALLLTTTAALADKIEDIKNRLTLIEGQGGGRSDTTTRFLTVGMAVVAVLVSLGIAFFQPGHAPAGIDARIDANSKRLDDTINRLDEIVRRLKP